MAKRCYLCGSSENLTYDHVPPKCFFPPDARLNIITVTCCHKCNNDFSRDDEEMVRWLTSSRFKSPQGTWIWENKVTKTFEKSAKLRTKLTKFIGSKTIVTPLGEIQVPTVSNPADQVQRFLIRICKGMFAYFLPEFDYSEIKWEVMNLLPTPENRQLIESILPMLKHQARGDTVFKVWYNFANDRPDTGLFVLLFYHGACFLVFFGDAAK